MAKQIGNEGDDCVGRDSGRGPASGMTDDALTETIESLAARIEADTLELLLAVGEADARCLWAVDGALSCCAWLSRLCRIDGSTARNYVRVAAAMRRFEVLAQAMLDREVSYSKSRVLAAHLTPENAADLVELARETPLGALAAAIAAWAQRNEDPETIRRRQHDRRSVQWRLEPDGMVTLIARLPPHSAGVVCSMIDSFRDATERRPAATDRNTAHSDRASHAGPESLGGNQPGREQGRKVPAGTSAKHPDSGLSEESQPRTGRRPTVRQQRADALVALATGGAGKVETEIVIHVRPEGNALADGTPLSDHAVTSAIPGALISLLVHDMHRQPIDASPRRRIPTPRQRRVLDERYKECQEPGCSATMFLQYDHREPYSRGGPTILANLQRLCGPHNRARQT